MRLLRRTSLSGLATRRTALEWKISKLWRRGTTRGTSVSIAGSARGWVHARMLSTGMLSTRRTLVSGVVALAESSVMGGLLSEWPLLLLHWQALREALCHALGRTALCVRVALGTRSREGRRAAWWRLGSHRRSRRIHRACVATNGAKVSGTRSGSHRERLWRRHIRRVLIEGGWRRLWARDGTSIVHGWHRWRVQNLERHVLATFRK